MANPHRHHRRPHPQEKADPFLAKYSASELHTASEFLSNWLPFLSEGLCRPCKRKLSERIGSLDPTEANSVEQEGANSAVSARNNLDMHDCNGSPDDFDTHSLGSWKDDANANDDTDANSEGSCKDGETGSFVPVTEIQGEASSSGTLGALPVSSETPTVKMSWADMAQEDEDFEDDASWQIENGHAAQDETMAKKEFAELPREERELIRFMNVKRKKDFTSFERIRGKFVNILDGLELHSHVFSAAEQKRIVEAVELLQEKGRKGELRGRTFSAPRKWMKGKGRVTMQFGCCYNYSTDKKGNLPGILKDEFVEPIPPLLKTMIKRLVRWHVLPPSCVPDSCIINVYDVGDCIPPHIDNHDFVRPFCTVSFLSECKILFGSELKSVSPGEFSGNFDISLPVGSVLVLNGNGADVAKHCVPAVPQKRISITFRKMDATKCPIGFVPEPDLQGLKPLVVETDKPRNTSSTGPAKRQVSRRDDREENAATEGRGSTRPQSLMVEVDMSRGPPKRQVFRRDDWEENTHTEGRGSAQRGLGPSFSPYQPHRGRNRRTVRITYDG